MGLTKKKLADIRPLLGAVVGRGFNILLRAAAHLLTGAQYLTILNSRREGYNEVEEKATTK